MSRDILAGEWKPKLTGRVTRFVLGFFDEQRWLRLDELESQMRVSAIEGFDCSKDGELVVERLAPPEHLEH